MELTSAIKFRTLLEDGERFREGFVIRIVTILFFLLVYSTHGKSKCVILAESSLACIFLF